MARKKENATAGKVSAVAWTMKAEGGNVIT